MPAALIMAAGHGTRMRSRIPKVLHGVCGRPMLEWVIQAARDAGADRVVAVVRPDSGVAERLPDGVEAAEQREGEGTGSAGEFLQVAQVVYTLTQFDTVSGVLFEVEGKPLKMTPARSA